MKVIFRPKKINKPKKKGWGGLPNLDWIGILIFLVVRSPYKFPEPYDNPFCDFSNGGANNNKNNKRKRLITKNSGLPKFAPLVARTNKMYTCYLKACKVYVSQ